MSTPVLPVIIQGPGVIRHNSFTYFFGREGAKLTLTRQTDQTEDDFHGIVGETAIGGPMVDLSFTPTGMIKSLIKPYPYGPSSLVAGFYSGRSILTGSVVIATKAGQVLTWARGGISQSPELSLRPRGKAFGAMTISMLNKIDTAQTDAAVLKAISAASFAETSFDETTIVKDLYTATLGSRSAPFDAIGARTGFVLKPIYDIIDVPDDHVGVADKLLNAVGWGVSFEPNNLTEAQVDELCAWQGADAVLAGQSIGKAAEDLIIDADFLTATLHNVGFTKASHGYGSTQARNQGIEGKAVMTFNAGVPNPLISLVIN
jgi:hypothetical protein